MKRARNIVLMLTTRAFTHLLHVIYARRVACPRLLPELALSLQGVLGIFKQETEGVQSSNRRLDLELLLHPGLIETTLSQNPTVSPARLASRPPN